MKLVEIQQPRVNVFVDIDSIRHVCLYAYSMPHPHSKIHIDLSDHIAVNIDIPAEHSLSTEEAMVYIREFVRSMNEQSTSGRRDEEMKKLIESLLEKLNSPFPMYGIQPATIPFDPNHPTCASDTKNITRPSESSDRTGG